MNDLDAYARLIADRTGVFVSDVRKVLAEMQNVGLPMTQGNDYSRVNQNDTRGVYNNFIMGNPG